MWHTIENKVRQNERISKEEALWLYRSAPAQDLYDLADFAKQRLHGDKVYWVNNRQINYTNVCVLNCRFCAFSKIKKDSPTAYDWGPEVVLDKARESIAQGAQELHIVGGLHPDHPLQYYIDMLSNLRANFPKVSLKAFTAVELIHFAHLENITVAAVLQRLQQAGLQALPGGGAEILVPEVRDEICGEKESGEQWLQVHRIAHQMGIPSNATMLFGHIESLEDRVEHLDMLRNLEDEAPGFFAFIPLVFHPENNALGRKVKNMTPPEDRLRTIAVSRLFLDNIPHIKAYWVQLSVPVAQQALRAGASDLDGTIAEEKITAAAGAQSARGLTVAQMNQLILDMGCTPVERNGLYETALVENKSPSIGI